MATFVLTAKTDINRPKANLHIDKGAQFQLHINVVGINPCNLFNNERCRDELMRQFRFNGIDLPRTDPIVASKSYWDVKQL